MKKRVYVAYTGGTIGMKRTADGYVPQTGSLQKQMAAMPELRHASMPSFKIHEYDPLLDSSNMTPSQWVAIARDLAANYDRYDGFVVVHGTDRLAVSGERTCEMWQPPASPIVFTGAMRPYELRSTDALQNLTEALLAAQVMPPGVYVAMHSRVLAFPGVVKDRVLGTFVKE